MVPEQPIDDSAKPIVENRPTLPVASIADGPAIDRVKKSISILTATVCGVIAFFLSHQLSGGLDTRRIVPHLFFSIAATPGTIASEPIVTYYEIADHQYLSFQFAGIATTGKIAVLIPFAKRCTLDGVNPSRGLEGKPIDLSLPKAGAYAGDMLWHDAFVASLSVAAGRNGYLSCEIEQSAWHKTHVERFLSLGYVGERRSISPLRAMNETGMRIPPEVHFAMDQFSSSFENLQVFGGRTTSTILPANDQSQTYDSLHARFLEASGGGNNVDVYWSDEGAAGRRDILLLLIGAFAGATVTAIYDVLMRLVDFPLFPPKAPITKTK